MVRPPTRSGGNWCAGRPPRRMKILSLPPLWRSPSATSRAVLRPPPMSQVTRLTKFPKSYVGGGELTAGEAKLPARTSRSKAVAVARALVQLPAATDRTSW